MKNSLKRVFTMFMVVCMVFSMLPSVATASEAYDPGDIYYASAGDSDVFETYEGEESALAPAYSEAEAWEDAPADEDVSAPETPAEVPSDDTNINSDELDTEDPGVGPDASMAGEELSEDPADESAEELTEDDLPDEAAEPEAATEDAAYAVAGTLQAAINDIAAREDADLRVDTIKLGKDYTENLIIPDGTVITLDLAGHTIAHDPDPAALITGENHISVFGTLYITDTVGGGAIISSGVSGVRGINVCNRGSMTIYGGTISGYTVPTNGAGIYVENGGALTILGGTISGNTAGYYGGGIYAVVADALALRGGTITGNTAEYGGGVALYKGIESMVLSGVSITANHANTNGGGIYCENYAVISNSGDVYLTDNTCGGNGAGAYFATRVSLTLTEGFVLTRNRSGMAGGGIYITSNTTYNGSTLVMSDLILWDNEAGTAGAGGSGGAICFANARGASIHNVTITNCTIRDNISAGGAAGILLAPWTKLTMTDCRFERNIGTAIAGSNGSGGGLYVGNADASSRRNNITITDCEFIENDLAAPGNSEYGGGLHLGNYSTYTVDNCDFIGNTGARYGGGMYLGSYGSGTIKNCYFTKNLNQTNFSSAQYGAGLYINSNGTNNIEDTTITENGHAANATYGGGLYTNGTAYLRRVTISDNTATNYGGGSYNPGTSHWYDCTVTGNKINSDRGGGIYCATIHLHGGNYLADNVNGGSYGGAVAADHFYMYAADPGQPETVIENNIAGYGGGVYTWHDFTMSGGIIRNNTARSNGGGVCMSYYYRYNHKISGGEITGNTAPYGGGVFVYSAHNPTPYGADQARDNMVTISNAKICGNTATTSGGGIYVSDRGKVVLLSGARVERNISNGTGGGIAANCRGMLNYLDGTRYSVEVKGGSLRDNTSYGMGRDLYMNCKYSDYRHYVRPVMKLTAAANMDGAASNAAWYDEYNNEYITTAYDNYDEVEALEKYTYDPETGEKNGVAADGNITKDFGFTFSSASVTPVCTVDGVEYISIQAAAEAIAAGETNGVTTIVMVDEAWEDVVFPAPEAGATASYTLDLAGYEVHGDVGTVITVPAGVVLTIDDTSAGHTGAILDGRGQTVTVGEKSYLCGGGLFIAGKVTMNDVTVSKNKGDYGSAVYLRDGAELVMNDCTVTANRNVYGTIYMCYSAIDGTTGGAHLVMNGGAITANQGRGIVADGTSTVELTDVVISNNSTTNGYHGAGIALYNNATLTMLGGAITGNTASQYGGGVYMESKAQATFTDVTFETNKATSYYGGAIYATGSSVLTATDCRFLENTGNWGGAVHTASSADATLERCVFTGNSSSAGGNGGAIVAYSTTMLKARNCTFTGNKGGYGGAVYISSVQAELRGCTITDNTAFINGGGIFLANNNNSRLFMYDTVVSGNSADSYGGGIYVGAGQAHLYSGHEIKNNRAGINGGGIYVAGGYPTHLRLGSGKVYHNTADTGAAGDIYLTAKSLFYRDDDAAEDTRTAEYMGIDGIECWFDATRDVAYVADGSDKLGAEGVKNLKTDLVDANSQVRQDSSLTGRDVPTYTGAVARIGEEGYRSITAAMAAADAMAAEAMAADTTLTSYPVTITLLRDVTEKVNAVSVKADITLDMAGHTVTVPEGEHNAFYVYSTNMTFTGGTVTVPGGGADISRMRGMYISGTSAVTMEGMELTGFDFNGNGGAIYLNSGTLTLNAGTRIHDCKAINGGGIYQYCGTDKIRSIVNVHDDVTLENNTATEGGGAVYTRSINIVNYHTEFYMDGGIVRGNTAANGGGLHFNFNYDQQEENKVYITGGLFEENHATTYGGAFYYIGSNSNNEKDDIQIYGVTMQNNTAAAGGAIYGNYICHTYYSFILGKEGTETIFTGNRATGTGGAVYLSSEQSYSHCELAYLKAYDNVSTDGSAGGVYVRAGQMIINECDVYGNTAWINGGGIYIVASKLDMTGGEVYNNKCAGKGDENRGYGGGICINTLNNLADEVIAITGTKVHHNTSALRGGGLYMYLDYQKRNARLTGLEIYENTVDGTGINTLGNCLTGEGGGLCFGGYSNGPHIVTVDHCNIHDNTARNNGGGIASYSARSFTLEVFDSRIENNHANVSTTSDQLYGGGGIYGMTRDATRLDIYLERTIVSGNTTGGNGGGVMLPQLWNMASILSVKDSDIINNTAARNGGGIEVSCASSTATTYDGYPGPTLIIDHSNITGNEADFNGGGIYNYYHCKNTSVQNGSVITENVAKLSGGGIYTLGHRTRITLVPAAEATEDTDAIARSFLYNNTASLGQDVYAAKGANIELIKASTMFDKLTDGRQATVWLEEQTGREYDKLIRFEPAGSIQALTLVYLPVAPVAAVDGVIYSSVQEAINAVCARSDLTGTVTIVADCEESVSVPGGANITLNLNGYTLAGSGTAAITARGNVTIIDEDKGAIDGDDGSTYTYNNTAGAVGTITGSAAIAGGVYVDSGSVTMKSGQISGCIAGLNKDTAGYGGAAVGINSGTFTLEGGKLCDNKAVFGSAVLLKTASASFIMTGGEISNNTAVRTGTANKGLGAIYNIGGTVKIYAGEIKNNTSDLYGGAIYNSSGTVNISGGTISGNSSYQRGGAIYVNSGTVTVSGATVSNNRITSAKTGDATLSSGGAIYLNNGTLIIDEGAMLTGNYAPRGGAIYQNKGTVTIMGGTITGNTAQMGGGCAQNPTPGDGTTRMELARGKVYGNVSTLNAGNDFYSGYEAGTRETYQKNYVEKTLSPCLVLIAASDMNVPGYNVWKDQDYPGSNRVGTEIYAVDKEGNEKPDCGEYITAGLFAGVCNAQLTAAYYDTEIVKNLDTDYYVESVSIIAKDKDGNIIEGVSDGTADFDDGKKAGYQNAKPSEVTAKDLYEAGQASASSDSYIYNGQPYNYIEYNGKKYEMEQAVSWLPGCDSGAHNGIVRTYDTLTYSLGYTFKSDVMKDPEVNHLYHLWVEAVLPCTSSEATFVVGKSLTTHAITTEIRDGKEVQVLRGYKETQTKSMGGTDFVTLDVKVYGMEDGATLKPTFSLWTEEHEAQKASCQAKTVTVSAAPSMYNIELEANKEMVYTAYFDLESGTEISETVATSEENKNNPNIVYGTMLGYGVTLELFNDPSGKGLKGVGIPADQLTFDLNFKGQIFLDGQLYADGQSFAPYIWAYKPNDSVATGTALGGTGRTMNMNWNDEDDLTKRTYYAYDAAPYNEGGGDSSCFRGGQWLMTGSQPAADAQETTVHMDVSGFFINTDANPTKNSSGNTDDVFKVANVKAFSAGYVQVLFPLDVLKEDKSINGYVEVSMKAAATKLNEPKAQYDADKLYPLDADLLAKQLEALNEYYELDDAQTLVSSGLAVGERRYADNYCQQTQGMYIYNIDGNGNILTKTNRFYKSDGSSLIGATNAGDGSTPIASTVYVGGTFQLSSAAYRTDDIENDPAHYFENDSLYDSQYWNNTEYNYMTAMDILQKIDASAFVPAGTSAIIQQDYKLSGNSNKIGGDAFIISSTETQTEWSTTATYSYNLTILYAAKPDGTNWNKLYFDEFDKANGNAPIYTGLDSGDYDDGGVAEMNAYRPEDLLYFETLDELHQYFGGEGACVGILYQFRNCCFRTGRVLTVRAKAQVTDDFDMTGRTYCTTNNYRAWLTYRPYYKLWNAKGTLAEHLYSYNVVTGAQTISENGATAYDGRTTAHPSGPSVSRYDDGYRMAQYRNGVKVGGSHTGEKQGNTVLLYTLNTSISLGITTMQGNRAKTSYDISKGEREVSFRVEPTVSISSDAKKVDLVENGTQSTEVTVEVVLPKEIRYEDNSISFEYKKGGYSEGELFWDVTVVENPDGTQTLRASTKVSNINLALPDVRFSCVIGNVEDPSKDVPENCSCVVTANIYAVYEEEGLTAANTKSANQSISIVRTPNDGITKGVGKQIVNLGEDLEYTLSYTNFAESAAQLKLVDVLPYNGDGRGTSFTGGYRVSSLQLSFTNAVDFTNFTAEATAGAMKLEKGKPNPTDATGRTNLINAFDSDSIAALDFTADEDTHTVSFTLPEDVTVLAGDKSGIAIYGDFAKPKLSSNGRITVRVVLTPMKADGDEGVNGLLRDADGKTQSGGNTYQNTFFFKSGTTPVLSNKVSIATINRVISGVVWMDQNNDGLYDSTFNMTGHTGKTLEYPLKDVDVKLYYAQTVQTEEETLAPIALPDTTRTVYDVLGNEIAAIATDENGRYQFDNLPAGDYVVVFGDEGTAYTWNGQTPLDFGELSVTKLSQTGVTNGNKTDPVYSGDSLSTAHTTSVIHMPASEAIHISPYTSPNWNCGLYFKELSIVKQWKNMVDNIPTGTEIALGITGTLENGSETPYDTTVIMTKTESGVLSMLGDSTELSVAVEDRNPDIKWTLQNIPLRAETAGRVSIEYAVKEWAIRSATAKDAEDHALDLRDYYETVQPDELTFSGNLYRFTVTNTQKLGTITVSKVTGGGDKLEGAVFGIYQTPEETVAATATTAGAKDGVTVVNNDKTTYTYGENKTVNERTRQTTRINNNLDGKAVAVFNNLPLYGENGKLYYTVREIGVPAGYIALGNFLDLTDIQLADKEEYSTEYQVVNTKAMALPATGGAGLTSVVMAGTAVTMLGGLWLMQETCKRKKKEMDGEQ